MLDLNQAWTALRDVAMTLVVIVAAVIVIEVITYLVFVRWRKSRLALPIMLVTPAVIGLLVLYVYPLLWELNVSFTKMSLRYFIDPGFLGLNTEQGQHLRRPPELHRRVHEARPAADQLLPAVRARPSSGPPSTCSSTSRWASGWR